ncbi:hypothetical protein FC65_GL000692 [Ligilactobacillus acidipiscis DSM 15836]|uniref:Uncharacterized protein n=2 Tax=Ligilactobacillus acidipiscis TaxID=89059 RepID=A0A0R2JDU8_9LACO|nr:hypothetical protein [Ligilactobacillus acidipiscis]KRM23507.1 hypothetical protein FC65_GL000692 [Ligilactobacillus acidipiscis DSM 15836]KRN75518.1 hypothetical protein IV43_GL000886 [Ligilactobacillus acidipiscis]SFV40502.1 hypothetical protein LAC1533_1082 [Ligilactobacillus acidipiscis]GAW64692.1 hypothetical protein Lacidipiscis_01897 [Ligilactobacillus acidipiscis]GEN21821.1 hypothetical protein LAC02_51020 [Ligilactobacillus acidipiscis]
MEEKIVFNSNLKIKPIDVDNESKASIWAQTEESFLKNKTMMNVMRRLATE